MYKLVHTSFNFRGACEVQERLYKPVWWYIICTYTQRNPTSLSLRIVSAAGRNSLLHFMTSDRPLLEHTRLAYQDETTGKLMDHYFFFLLLTTCISSGDQLNQRRIGKHSMPS